MGEGHFTFDQKWINISENVLLNLGFSVKTLKIKWAMGMIRYYDLFISQLNWLSRKILIKNEYQEDRKLHCIVNTSLSWICHIIMWHAFYCIYFTCLVCSERTTKQSLHQKLDCRQNNNGTVIQTVYDFVNSWQIQKSRYVFNLINKFKKIYNNMTFLKLGSRVK